MNPALALNNGMVVPRLGLGLWQVPDDDAEILVKNALKAGYRSFDTAARYHNEHGLGAAVAACGLPREEIVISSKLWNSDHGADEARRALDATLARLGLEWIDLYLIHWPLPDLDRYVETWRALEKLHAEGRIRAIGVSNFTVGQLSRLMGECGIVPAVNQVELHLLFQQRELREFHARHGIATQAWSPLGSSQGLLSLPVLREVSESHRRSPAQVVIRWHLQLGNLVIPKTATLKRLTENLDVFGFALDEQEMAALGSIDAGRRWGPDPENFDLG